MSEQSKGIEVFCRYRIKPGKQHEFGRLLQDHWTTLHHLGLTTDEPARSWRAEDKSGNVAFIESFAWLDEQAMQTAHETPAVMALWEPMGALCVDMEFWHVQPINE